MVQQVFHENRLARVPLADEEEDARLLDGGGIEFAYPESHGRGNLCVSLMGEKKRVCGTRSVLRFCSVCEKVIVMHHLYVGRDVQRPDRHNLGSTLCLRVVDLLLPLGVSVDVIVCHGRGGHRGIVGTPTLVDAEGTFHQGSEALYALEVLLSRAASTTTTSKKDRGTSRGTGGRVAATNDDDDDGFPASGRMSLPLEDDDDGSVDEDKKIGIDETNQLISMHQSAMKNEPSSSTPPPPPPPSASS